MNQKDTDTHPQWDELRNDDRSPMIDKCKKDMYKINNKANDFKI